MLDTGTNKLLPQLSLGMFYTPSEDAVIGPIEDLINEGHFPKYRNYIFKEYMEEFYRQEGKRRRVKEAFFFNGKRKLLSCNLKNLFF